MTEQQDILPVQQGFALRELSHHMYPSPGRGSPFVSAFDQVKKRNEFVQEHAASAAEYNVAMSLTDVDYSDETIQTLVRESAVVRLGERGNSGLFQNHCMLLHMTNDDNPCVVEVWSDPIDLEGDISEDEAYSRKGKAEMNMYMKLLDFWKDHPDARVVGRILPGMRLTVADK